MTTIRTIGAALLAALILTLAATAAGASTPRVRIDRVRQSASNPAKITYRLSVHGAKGPGTLYLLNNGQRTCATTHRTRTCTVFYPPSLGIEQVVIVYRSRAGAIANRAYVITITQSFVNVDSPGRPDVFYNVFP